MPIYYYNCQSCNHTLKSMHSIKDTLIDCPECSKPELVRTPSNFISLTKTEADNKTGELVKEKIEEFRSDLKKEKKKLASESL